MQSGIFFQGALVGFFIAAPVGPIGVLCIRRSLSDGPRYGLVAGLGAATADAVYGAIAAFGLSSVSGFLVGQQRWLALFGGIFLCYLGFRTFVSSPASSPAETSGQGMIGVYFSTLLLTLTNPATILSFVAVFAGLGWSKAADYAGASLLVLGVFSGSALWWMILSNGVALVRGRITAVWMRRINRVSGCFLLCFGMLSLVRILK